MKAKEAHLRLTAENKPAFDLQTIKPRQRLFMVLVNLVVKGQPDIDVRKKR